MAKAGPTATGAADLFPSTSWAPSLPVPVVAGAPRFGLDRRCLDLYKPKALGEPLEQFDKGPYTLAKARGEALEFLRPSNPPVLTDAQARREDGMIRARRR